MNIQLFLIVTVVCTLLQVVQTDGIDATETQPVQVGRRQNKDFYLKLNSSNINCDDVNNTYLVSERVCVKSEDLLSACTSAAVITPTNLSMNYTAIALLDSRTANITSLLISPDVNAILKFSESGQLVNSSYCSIASLEVFRGWKKVFVIDHDGFSLTVNGTVEINKNELAYSIEDYTGELYRMKLSCSGGGLPRNGCLFFKVFGTTYVKNAKFDCTVPGTLTNFTEECNITTNDNLLSDSESIRATTATTTVNDDNATDSAHGISKVSVVVACVVAVLVLAIVMAIFAVCIIVCLCRHKGAPHKSKTAPLEGEGLSHEVQRQDCVFVVDSSSGNEYHTLTPQVSATAISKKDVENHTYAAALQNTKPHKAIDNSVEYENSVNITPMSDKKSTSQKQQVGVSNALFDHFDNSVSEKQNSFMDHSDPSEHVYAEPVRKKNKSSIKVNQYDQPPKEDIDHKEGDLEKEADHMYAELERPEPQPPLYVQESLC